MTKQRFMDGLEILIDKSYTFSKYQERLLFGNFKSMSDKEWEQKCKDFPEAPDMNSYDTLKWVMEKMNEKI